MSSYILCADDLALSPGISAAIAGLAKAGCINAISCMTACPGWTDDAHLLDDLGVGRGLGGSPEGTPGSSVDIGLHLVLASEQPLTRMARQQPDGRLPSADRIMALAYARRLDLDEISREIEAQFAAFYAARGCPPDFVDAHQHIHVHPGIRERVIAATLRHAPQAWIRNPSDRLGSALRRPFVGKAIGSAVHALGFAATVRRAGLRTNDSFAGHYDFAGDYNALLPHFFQAPGAFHLIMCHPGDGVLEGDTIAQARLAETVAIGKMPLVDRIDLLEAHFAS